jgi:hypothetical protein
MCPPPVSSARARRKRFALRGKSTCVRGSGPRADIDSAETVQVAKRIRAADVPRPARCRMRLDAEHAWAVLIVLEGNRCAGDGAAPSPSGNRPDHNRPKPAGLCRAHPALWRARPPSASSTVPTTRRCLVARSPGAPGEAEIAPQRSMTRPWKERFENSSIPRACARFTAPISRAQAVAVLQGRLRKQDARGYVLPRRRRGWRSCCFRRSLAACTNDGTAAFPNFARTKRARLRQPHAHGCGLERRRTPAPATLGALPQTRQISGRPARFSQPYAGTKRRGAWFS